MDPIAALSAPFVVDLAPAELDRFLGPRQLRVVHISSQRPFGVVVRTLLHGALGSELRCARIERRDLVEAPDSVRVRMGSWVKLAGTGAFPPPPGYYLLRGRGLLGFHPELPETSVLDAATAGSRGLLTLLTRRSGAAAGRAALEGRPELELLRFFQEAACGTTPRRAPAAGDRRTGSDRRSSWRRKGKGNPRRREERIAAELDAACALLGVTPGTPLREVRAARNKMMRANHPDRLGHQPDRQAEATELVVKLNEAWSVIRAAHEARQGA